MGLSGQLTRIPTGTHLVRAGSVSPVPYLLFWQLFARCVRLSDGAGQQLPHGSVPSSDFWLAATADSPDRRSITRGATRLSGILVSGWVWHTGHKCQPHSKKRFTGANTNITSRSIRRTANIMGKAIYLYNFWTFTHHFPFSAIYPRPSNLSYNVPRRKNLPTSGDGYPPAPKRNLGPVRPLTKY